MTEAEKNILWNGCPYFGGIYDFFNYLESKKYKIQNRVMIARYTGKTKCPECHGTRLKPEASYVKIGGKSVPELVEMPVSDLKVFFDTLSLTPAQNKGQKGSFPILRTDLNFYLK